MPIELEDDRAKVGIGLVEETDGDRVAVAGVAPGLLLPRDAEAVETSEEACRLFDAVLGLPVGVLAGCAELLELDGA